MKTPQEAVFASEEAEAVPMESGEFCRNGLHALIRMTWEPLFLRRSLYLFSNKNEKKG
ncbi:hypothetical protein [Salinibacillus xinjiangensis]|uniref:Uncharacterized protein n=1 Tax=Salinibacillus xinjiangensis TaxID=1229268 RepID=A0A6G1X2Q6_9BACI|nr:hypothetical protein [Salinibacillus xinjiangensis]MRG85199.1 hypothetical protein [Salinibacillus xinjiangensis]